MKSPWDSKSMYQSMYPEMIRIKSYQRLLLLVLFPWFVQLEFLNFRSQWTNSTSRTHQIELPRFELGLQSLFDLVSGGFARAELGRDAL